MSGAPWVPCVYHGREPEAHRRKRLVSYLCYIAECVHPALDARVVEVDIHIDGPAVMLLPEHDRHFVELRGVHVAGVELLLTDYRNKVHRLPFTFIETVQLGHPALPELEGRLVRIDDESVCQRHEHSTIQSAKWLLGDRVTLRLTGHLEYEFEVLMAFVRHNFMQGLTYSRRTELPRYEDFELWYFSLPGLPRSQQNVAGILEFWAEKWGGRRLHKKSAYRITDEVRSRLEWQGSVETVVTGAVINLLRRAHAQG